MTNDYFVHSSTLSRHTLGRAEAVNAIFDGIEGGFDKLPTPDEVKQARVTYVTDSGSADALVVNPTYAISSYVEGLRLVVKIGNTNTGTATINVSSLGVKAVKRHDGTTLVAGDLVAGSIVEMIYDGTEFRIAGAPSSAPEQLADGTEATPGFRFENDADTGMYRPTTNTLGWVTGGSEGLRLDASGNLVFAKDTNTYIGHPAADTLAITTGGSERLRINSTGVGVGETTPTCALHVSGSMQIDHAGADEDVLVIGDPTTLANNTGIYLRTTGEAVLQSANGGKFVWQDANPTEYMRLDTSTGNVGIGETTPSRRLHVNSGTTDNIALFESADAGAYISISDSNTTANTYVGVGAVGDELVLRAGDGNRMRIDSDGNVGIGTQSPAEMLHISGRDPSIRLTDTDTGHDNAIIADSTSGSIGINADLNDEVADSRISFAVDGNVEAVLDPSFGLGIGDTANTNMTRGITINQSSSDDEILSFKSSDIAHGMTDVTETDTYGRLSKASGSSGGLYLAGLSEGNLGLVADGYVVSEITTDTVSSTAAITQRARLRSGTTYAGLGTTGNLFAVQNNNSTHFLIKGNGDIHGSDTDGATALDEYEDAELVRAYELSRTSEGIIRSKWDEFLRHNREDLIRAGILAPDGPDGSKGLVNYSQLWRLHSGAIWQTYSRVRDIEAQFASMEAVIASQARQIENLSNRIH